MLSKEENELLCRVGPGAPMGDVFRRYWLPAVRSIDLPAPDCPPVRVRLLGEDLVAFRDSNGRVGLLAEKCSHRRASLFYGRNEECGLRCIYHGWKYDVDGNILDTPAEPAESMIKHHVKHPAYPCHEVNGMVYAYLGPKERMPLIPDLPWFALSAEHVSIGAPVINECNWLQTQEGNIDSTHSPFLHARRAVDGAYRAGGQTNQPYRTQANPPNFQIDRTPWGVRAVVRYPAPDGAAFTRTNTFIMPVYTALPNGIQVDGRLDGFNVNTEVPMDDEHTMRYTITVQRTTPVNREHRSFSPDEILPNGVKVVNRQNDYKIDREKQSSGLVFSGLDWSFPTQDGAAVESMGPIADREHEHLGQGDSQIASVRRYLADAVREVQNGGDAPGVAFDVEDNDFSDLIMVSAVVPAGVDWKRYAPQVTTHVLAGVGA
jgi:phenylpropionate dioxygenase-like ring-hydroxylating dioxygenase large terminal subunit